jgi:hypothetical protein
MRDYLNIGATPADETCEQLGPNYDPMKARAECNAFAKQIIRQFGEPPFGADIRVKSFTHDFGTYQEVVIWFMDDIEETIDYAYKVENEVAATWDDEAKKELGIDIKPSL